METFEWTLNLQRMLKQMFVIWTLKQSPGVIVKNLVMDFLKTDINYCDVNVLY